MNIKEVQQWKAITLLRYRQATAKYAREKRSYSLFRQKQKELRKVKARKVWSAKTELKHAKIGYHRMTLAVKFWLG